MAWITAVQAGNFLGVNPEWEAFQNKDELLDLSSNRLEQLTFKDEPIDRVIARYVDGNSLSKVASSDDFLFHAQRGNWDFQEALGWTRNNEGINLVVHEDEVAFIFPEAGQTRLIEFVLTFKQIQSLHSFGGTFEGKIALDLTLGTSGMFSSIETEQATSIVDKFGEQVFSTFEARRINAAFFHNGVHVSLRNVEGTSGVVFNGVNTVDVVDENGNESTNTVPELFPSDYFEYTFKVINGLDKTMFLYVNNILVGNPTFARNTGGTDNNRLLYAAGSGSGLRQSYVWFFGSMINTENPITIPIRLVGACALLALQYGKFPPTFVGDQAYLENENDYNRMQDLPINVQAAIEPFLADYESVIDEDGIATTTERGEEPSAPSLTEITKLEHI